MTKHTPESPEQQAYVAAVLAYTAACALAAEQVEKIPEPERDEDIDAWSEAVQAIHDSLRTHELFTARTRAEDALIDWAIEKARKETIQRPEWRAIRQALPRIKQRLAYRQQIISLCMRLR